MAIDMSTVKSIEFNNKQVKKIEDANGNVLWSRFKGVKATPIKIWTGMVIGNTYANPLYWTISQLSSAIASPSSSSGASEFYFFTHNQILALLDENFDFENGTYNNESIGSYGSYEDGYFHMRVPSYLDYTVYICFIQNNKIYFVGNRQTNYATNGGLLGYTDDYTKAYMFRAQINGNTAMLKTGSYYAYNRNTLKYVTSVDGLIDIRATHGSATTIPYQSITNPNANN